MPEMTHDTQTAPDYMADKFIAERAYHYWEERGRPFGSPTVDWFRAVKDIRGEMTRSSGNWQS